MNNRAPGWRLLAATALLASSVGACAPGSTSGQSGASADSRTPKVLTIGIQRAPDDLHPDLGQRDPGVGGASTLFDIPQDELVISDDTGAYVARLASEQISTSTGTWVLNPDGSMDTTWRLRDGVRWHDGAAFTSADLLFAFGVYKDPQVPNGIGVPLGLMAGVTAPDPLTFVVHWTSTYLQADRAIGLIPMPQHLLQDLHRTDPANFIYSRLFTSEFVGLGPYRLVHWDPGSHIQFDRFDGYYLGRPPLNTIVVRIIPDDTALVANILAGAVDAVLLPTADVDAMLEVKKRWEGTRNQVYIRPASPGGGLRHLEIQFRPELEQPRPGLPNRMVRQALLQAIDRQRLADVVTDSLSPVADSWVPPYHPLRSQLEAAVPRFPYDVRAAQQLLTQGGWVRGADSVLVHQQSGERFEIKLYSSQGTRYERLINVIADDWKSVGALPMLDVIPTALAGDREYRAKLPGAGATGGVGYDAFSTDRLHSKFISSPANRWAASNRGGTAIPGWTRSSTRFP